VSTFAPSLPTPVRLAEPVPYLHLSKRHNDKTWKHYTYMHMHMSISSRKTRPSTPAFLAK